MKGTSLNVHFSPERDDVYDLRNVLDQLCEQKPDIAWKIATSDDEDYKIELDTQYMSESPAIIEATREIAANRWFWAFSSEWNLYHNDEDGAGIQIDYHLSSKSAEMKQVLDWLNVFNPISVEIESAITYDDEDLS